VTRDGAAFALLNAENSLALHRRILEEDKRAELEAAKLEAEKSNLVEVPSPLPLSCLWVTTVAPG
jgi:hypothetical protein